MPSSSPLNRHLQDAEARHDAKSGIGGLQRAAGAHAGEQQAIERGYVPVRQIAGKVVGIWGDAHIRHLDGTVTPLHVGDVVRKGEVVLTAQDGIVQLEAHPTTLASDDVERTISQVDNGEIDVVPAAGPNSGGAGGSLEEGLRVGRDAESVTPAALDVPSVSGPLPTAAPLAVAPLPTAPVANPDTESTATGTPVAFDPRANDNSSSGLTVVAIAGHPIGPGTPVTLPQGVVTMNADGSLAFTPSQGFSGSLSFAYTEANAAGATATSTVTVAVAAPVDHPPAAAADAFSGFENQAFAGTLAGNDTPSVDGGNVWTLATGAAHGSVTVAADGSYTYAPAAGFHGTDSFTYTITDGAGTTSTATVTLTVAPAAPVAGPDIVAAHENTPVSGNLGGNDTPVAGEVNTWAVAAGPAHGTVAVGADGSYTYTPAPGFSGTDSFTYTVTDGSGQSSTASVTLSVAAATPSAVDDTVTGQENASVSGTLAGNDTPVAGEASTWSLGSAPAHGTVTVNPDGTFVYTPAPGYNGPDSFTYTLTDASGQASTASVALTVTAQAPSAGNDTASLGENGTISGTVAGNDAGVAGEASTWSLAGGPAHGTLVFNADGSYVYTPANGYNGTDQFSYTLTDSTGHASTATVTLAVAALQPAAGNDTAGVIENSSLSGNVSGNDAGVAGESSTWSLAAGPSHGTLVFNPDGSYVYTPTPGYNGADQFTYTLTDSTGHASTASVDLAVSALLPTAQDDNATVAENGAVSGSVAGNDAGVANESSTWSLATGPAHGTLVFDPNGSYTYTPTPGYSGTDKFTYTLTDSTGHTSTATVNIGVTGLTPIAQDDAATVAENGSVSGSVSANDVGVAHETSSWTLGTGPANGTLVFNTDGSYTYTPNPGYNGADSFTYTLVESGGATSTAAVNLNVTPLLPEAAGDTATVAENGSVTASVTANDAGVTGETSTWAVATNPANGTVTMAADGSYTYTPAAGYNGADSFTYTLTDSTGHTSTATVNLVVTALQPTAGDDTATVVENGSITGSVSANDAGVTGETSTWAVATNPAHGTVTMAADGSYTYTPTVGYNGADSFTYTLTDSTGHTSTATVNLTVTALQPAATTDQATVVENGSITASVTANDIGVTGETSTWAVATNPAHGTVTMAANGSYTYTPTVGYNGADSFTYTLTDSSGHTSAATVNLTVTALQPVATNDAATVLENGSVTASVTSNDVGVAGETSTWAVATHPSHGVVVFNADGSYTYTAAPGYNGTDSFTYTLTDATGHASTATVSLTVTALMPAAQDDSGVVIENGVVTGSVAGNDAGVPNEGSTWTVLANPAHGSVVMNADGSYTYTPTAGFNGIDKFTYALTDSTGHTSTATVNVTVAAQVPAAADDSVGVTENGSVSGNVAANDTGVAGESSTWTLATDVAHGTLVFNNDGSYTYTPTPGYNGPDKFTYTLTDSTGHTSSATVSLVVDALVPVARDDAASAVENGSISGSVAGNDSGVAHEASTWSLTAGPAHGALTFGTDGSYTYTPAAGFSGTDKFTYTLTDSTGHASTATVNLIVSGLTPIAQDDAATVVENGSLSGNVSTNDAGVSGETSTWSLATGPAHGALVFNADGSYTYTPAPGYNGTDKFSYTLTGSGGQTSTATVDLTVTALNPVARDDTAAVVENGSVSGSVSANDAGVANETSSWSLTTGPAHGTVTVDAAGNYSYTPTAGYNGTDSFTYALTDSTGHASTASVSLTVTALLPAAKDDAASIAENGEFTASVTANDVGVANEASTWSLTTSPTHGTVAFNADGSYTYTPTVGYNGADSFTYTLTDSTGHTSTATVNLTVTALQPVAASDTATVVENGSVTGSVSGNDAGVTGETSTWALATNPSHGSVTMGADGSYTYTPASGYNGTDSFTYTLTDSTGHTSTATVNLTVTALQPAATNDQATVVENGSVAASVSGNDVGVTGESSSWAIATNPAHGTVTMAANGSYTYTPASGYNGADSFTYTLTDSTGHTSTATVNLTITALQPVATNDTATVVENGSLTGSVTANDAGVAGETSTWAVTTNPAHGTVTMAANGSYTYTPASGYNGADSFTYTLTDSTGHTSTATVSLTVTALQPTAGNDTATVVENGSLTASVTANDAGVTGETSTWSLTTSPTHGTITFNANGSYTYTPTVGYNGADSFSYALTDSTGHTSTATVNLTVTALQPNAGNDTATVVENGSVAASVTGNDVGVTGEASTWSVATNPAHGTATMAANGSYTYTPTVGYNGTDSFTYTLTDSTGHTSTATVNLTITALQPVATNDAATVVENGSITASVTANDVGVTGETSTWAVATTPAHGTVTMTANGSYTYTPTAGYNGTDSFTYTLTDSTGHTSTATVNLTVTALQPTAANDTATVVENGSVTASVSGNDVGVTGETSSWAIATNPSHGTVTMTADGGYTYAPTVGYNGTDSFTYTLTDSTGHTSTATVNLTVTALQPVATNDQATVVENGSLTASVTANDSGVAGETSTWSLTTNPTHGTVTFNANGTYTYTPTVGYNGTDKFTYTLTDSTGHASTATVNLTITALQPTAGNDAATVVENGALTASVAGNDAGVSGETSTWAVATGPSHGTVTMAADGSYTYAPTSGYNGVDSFTYTLTDSTGHTSTATVNLTVTALQPAAANDTATVVENGSVTASVSGNDVGVTGETSTWAVTTNPAHGTVTMAANGSYTYTPASGYNGADSFTYTLTDSTGHTSTATVNLTVTALQPVATNDTATVVENGSLSASVTANDAGVTGEASTWAVATNPAHGTLTMAANGTYTYTPTVGYNGTDSFTYTITDSTGHASTATVNLTVTALQPTAGNDSATVTENGSVTASVTANDAGVTGETSTWAVATNPAHGTVTMAANGSYTYTPAVGYNGADSFTYTITDSTGHASTATVTLTVVAINPTATNDTFQASEDGTTGTLNLATNDTPVAGEASTWAVASTTTTHGTITPAADFATSGKFTYTPTSGYSGTDSFTYTLTDASGHSSTATVTINVAAINPTAANDAFTVTAGGPTPTLSVKTNDTPVAGETNAWSIKTNPTHGTLVPAADFASTGNFVYTPNTGYTGADTFTYLITDGSGHTSSATVTLTVAAEKPPAAVADTYAATENTLLVLNGAAGSATQAVTANDTDANGDALTVTQINGASIAAGGAVTVASGTVMMDGSGVLSFNPTTNFTGNTSFTYTISDGHGGTSTATVSIAVAAGTDEPTVTAGATGRWLFNENTGSTTRDAYDSYTGTLTNVNTANGGTAPTWVTGHNGTAGSALSFDGKGGIVSVPLADTAALTGTSSLSVWFNTTQVGSTIGWSSPSILGSEHQGDANDIQWGTINSKGQIGLGLGNDPTGVYSTAAVNDGNWHDLTITRSVNADGTSAVSVYIDGVLSNSATLAAQSPATNGIPTNELAGWGYTNGWTSTGADTTSGDVYYKGSLDDGRIYNHVLTADQTKAIYSVENGYETQAVANDGDAIKLTVADTHATALHVIGVENGMTLSDGTHTITSTGNSQVIDVTGWNLGALQLTNVGTGSATLEFDAINTNASTGQSEDTSTWLSVVNGTSLLGGTSGNDTLAATTSSATFISGGAGADTITGGGGNDRLLGGTGNDSISGGAGNDLIVGGAGNDTLTGGAGNDVFRWELGDHGTAGTPHVDTITDFSSAAGNMDVLDLRDLLGGANHNGTDPGNIASFLHFDHSGADTIIHVSSTGGFASGYSSGMEDETIVLKNVDLTAAGANNDSQIIHQLLTNGQLHLG